MRASLFKSMKWNSARLRFLFAARSTCFCNLGIHVRQYDLIGTCQSTSGTFWPSAVNFQPAAFCSFQSGMPLRTSIGITFILTIWLLVSLPSLRLARVINTLRNFCSVLKPHLAGSLYYIVEIELILPLQKLHSLYEELYGRKLAEFQRCQSSLRLRSPETIG